MKNITSLLFIGINIFIIGLIFSAGCTILQKSNTTTQLIKQNTTVTMFPFPSPNISTTIVSTTIIKPTVKPTTPITSRNVKEHFMDIAFGLGTSRLNRLDYNSSYPLTNIAVELNANDNDVLVVKNFTREFNALSRTIKLNENIKKSNGDLTIYFVSRNGLDAVENNNYTIVQSDEGVVFSKGPYINAELQGDERNRTIKRVLLYELGFTGESITYPDSIFYYYGYNNSILSFIDKKAIEIMYGPGLKRGMTVDNIRDVIYL